MASLINISSAVSLALHSMEYLTRNPGRLVSTREIAEGFEMSENHLAKVHQRLAKCGLIRAVRGPGGGVELAKAPEEITLLDIFTAIEGEVESGYCLLGEPTCGRRVCMMKDLVRKVHHDILDYFAKTRLSDVKED